MPLRGISAGFVPIQCAATTNKGKRCERKHFARIGVVWYCNVHRPAEYVKGG